MEKEIVALSNIKPCAMRGRNPDNPSDRTSGIYTEQRIELKNDGICNCITSVSKDTLYVSGVKMLAPVRTDYGKAIRKAYENHKIAEKRANMITYECKRNNYSNTITTVQKDNMYVGNVKGMEHTMTDEKTLDDYLYSAENGNKYGIFKLTAKECLRLQNVDENDIVMMMSVNSKSQCYKQAGNSITVSVLMAIFSQLGIVGVPKWNDMNDDERYKLIYKGCVINEQNDTQEPDMA